MQTTFINNVSMVHQDSIWFSLYKRATINIIGGNHHFCALTSLLCLHGKWGIFSVRSCCYQWFWTAKRIMEGQILKAVFLFLSSKRPNLTKCHTIWVWFQTISWCKFDMQANDNNTSHRKDDCICKPWQQ